MADISATARTRTRSLPQAQKLARVVRRRIQRLQLPDGAFFMTEAQLATRYRVSRTVAREAVSQLKALGLLESRKRKGLPAPIRSDCSPPACPRSPPPRMTGTNSHSSAMLSKLAPSNSPSAMPPLTKSNASKPSNSSSKSPSPPTSNPPKPHDSICNFTPGSCR